MENTIIKITFLQFLVHQTTSEVSNTCLVTDIQGGSDPHGFGRDAHFASSLQPHILFHLSIKQSFYLPNSVPITKLPFLLRFSSKLCYIFSIFMFPGKLDFSLMVIRTFQWMKNSTFAFNEEAAIFLLFLKSSSITEKSVTDLFQILENYPSSLKLGVGTNLLFSARLTIVLTRASITEIIPYCNECPVGSKLKRYKVVALTYLNLTNTNKFLIAENPLEIMHCLRTALEYSKPYRIYTRDILGTKLENL